MVRNAVTDSLRSRHVQTILIKQTDKQTDPPVQHIYTVILYVMVRRSQGHDQYISYTYIINHTTDTVISCTNKHLNNILGSTDQYNSIIHA